MEKNKRNLAIILAGGEGSRFKDEVPKQFLKLAGKPVIEHTLEIFERHSQIDEVFIITNPSFYDKTVEIVEDAGFKKITKILNGGNSRQESSKIGLVAGKDRFENVLVHDAVRPFLSKEIIDEMLEKLNEYDAIDVAIPSPDTIIQINNKRIIERIPDRSFLRRGQTPQGFKLKVIQQAHELATENGIQNATDDCSLILHFKLGEIYVVEGSDFNIKITYPIDIHIADKIFQIKNDEVDLADHEILKQKLKDKVLVIFGGSRGIGKSIYDLAVNFNAKAHAFSLSTGTDIRSYEDVKRALDKVYKKEKRIDAVIITAAVMQLGSIESIEPENIIKQIETNLSGNIFVAKEAISYLKEKGGHIVFFGSSSYTRGRPGYSIYSMTKSGLVNFAQGLADELAKYNIMVNVINPERTNTEMRRENFGKEDEETLLDPDFVALCTLSLLTKDITGSILDIRRSDQDLFNKKTRDRRL